MGWLDDVPDAPFRQPDRRPDKLTRCVCSECDEPFLSRRKNATCCTPACRTRKSRRLHGRKDWHNKGPIVRNRVKGRFAPGYTPASA